MTLRLMTLRLAAAAASSAVIGCALLGSTPAQAAGQSCVAVVVDPGGGTSGRCTTWRSGLTGLGVLSATGHSYRFAPSGLICAIDGFPADCHVDPTHYWSYWHRGAGSSSWAYSNEGAGTYRPGVRSTDGWAYQNGASRQPRNIPFTTICPIAAPTPSPTSSPTGRPTAPPPAGPSASPSRPAPPHTSGAGTTRAIPAAHPASRPAPSTAGAVIGRGPTAGPSSPARTAPTAAAAGASASLAAAGSASTTANVPDRADSSPQGRPLLLAGLGLVAAATLGTAAWRRTRTRD